MSKLILALAEINYSSH